MQNSTGKEEKRNSMKKYKTMSRVEVNMHNKRITINIITMHYIKYKRKT